MFIFAILAVALALVLGVAAGYVWGWMNGKSHAEHPDGPEICRARIAVAKNDAAAADQAARRWRARAELLEAQNDQHDRNLTFTTELLLSEIDKATNPVLCDHGLTAECPWCDSLPVPYVLVSSAPTVTLDAVKAGR